jgi:hypothetical protein
LNYAGWGLQYLGTLAAQVHCVQHDQDSSAQYFLMGWGHYWAFKSSPMPALVCAAPLELGPMASVNSQTSEGFP